MSTPVRALPAAAAGGARSSRHRWPARLDVLQSVSGLLLALFMWAHMAFVSSILLGPDAMWTVTRFFEGAFFFDRAYPGLVSVVVAVVFALFIAHAALAMRKFPLGWRQWATFGEHRGAMRHPDTTLWGWQAITGFALFFLGSAHLVTMLTQPGTIGPYGSADRVWSAHWWPVYLVLLLAVELHGGIGLYRLAIKWGWLDRGGDPRARRRRLMTAKWALTAFFVVLGLATLAAYMKLGIAHAPRAGEPYVPTWLRGASPSLAPAPASAPLPTAPAAAPR